MSVALVDHPTGLGPLDRPFAYTTFPDHRALRKGEEMASLRDLARTIPAMVAPTKAGLPFIKGATFGRAQTTKGCYRSDRNVLAVTAVEGDHDAGTMSPEEARDRLAAAGVAALVYTTPSHLKPGKGPRWRVLAPTSRALPPEDRARLVARLNGVLGGTLAQESFVLSQAFYAGTVAGEAPVSTFLSDGQPIDLAEDLDAGAVWAGALTRWAGAEGDGAGDTLAGLNEDGLLANLREGREVHWSTWALALDWAALGASQGEAVRWLRAALDSWPQERRDERWRNRRADVRRIVRDAFARHGAE